MYKSHIAHLTEAHRVLDNKIETLEKTGKFTDEQMQELKRQKLKFKDELSRYNKLQWEHDNEYVDFEDDR
jgi:uncharacterized protein YdcH (DUF465 family)